MSYHNKFNVWRPSVACLVVLFACVLVSTPLSAQDEDATRKLWDTAFKGAESKRAAGKRATPRRRYRVATPEVPTETVVGDTAIGVTIWRMRPATRRDAGERLLVQEAAGSVEWIPERVSSDVRLKEGNRVRLSVEAGRAGYLYVIDREQYEDGSLGDPYLIFPTTRTLGGKNEVKAGRIVEIPAQDDDTPFFTLKRSSTRQVGEVLSVIVTPAPIEGLEITESARMLSIEQVAAWEKSWGAQVGRLELEGGAQQPWTKEEREAGADQTRTLTADAPAPQTLFYSPLVKTGDPLLVKVSLKYGGTGAAARRKASN